MCWYNEDDFLKNHITCRLTFRTYSNLHAVWLKFPKKAFPDDIDIETIATHPISAIIIRKANRYIRDNVYHKPLKMVAKLKSIKK